MAEQIILRTNFQKLNLVKRGKVRDIYDLGEYFLIISSDRLSAFDVILNQGIPFKGKVLNKISQFWFDFSKNIIPNHLISTDIDKITPACTDYKNDLDGRSMLVKKTEVLPIECIVRGYISGSGWVDYQESGTISGLKLPKGLVESEKLPEPIFTPSTKAEIGDHDENISFLEAEKIVGKTNILKLQDAALNIYKSAADYALTKGIIIADTKMEFGLFNNEIILIDELLTPDSSRFWSAEHYQKGKSQDSFDKQFIRDYLLSIKFNKKPPPPDLPQEIIEMTSRKYLEALNLLTGLTVE